MIAINRHNYEEFFILYIDNELDAGERKSVEEFAAQHPDLKEELDMLMAAKLIPDHSLSFEGKEQLYKTVLPAALNETTFQESLLLYLDNELPASQMEALETYIAANPAAQQEWNLLQQTRLEPVTITFPYKQSLYRKEEKASVTIIRFRRWRVAAAAAVLLIGGYLTYNLLTGNAGNEEITVAKGEQPKKVNTAGTQQNSGTNPANPVVKDATPGINNTSLIDKAANAIAAGQLNRNNADGNKKKSGISVNNFIAPEQQAKNSENSIAAANTDITASLQPLEGKVETMTAVANIKSPLENIKNSGVTIQSPAPLNNQTASPTNKEVSSEDWAAAEPERKNKLRGFFRKTTRIFERTTNISATDGDDRLLIGGLAVRLK